MSVSIEGIDRLIAKLDRIDDKVHAKLADAALFVEGEARERAPKRTGALKGSIESKVEGDEAIIFSPEHYAPYVEFGTGLFAVNGDGRKTPWAYEDPITGETVFTRGSRPQPYLGPALRDNKDVILRFLKEGFDV